MWLPSSSSISFLALAIAVIGLPLMTAAAAGVGWDTCSQVILYDSTGAQRTSIPLDMISINGSLTVPGKSVIQLMPNAVIAGTVYKQAVAWVKTAPFDGMLAVVYQANFLTEAYFKAAFPGGPGCIDPNSLLIYPALKPAFVATPANLTLNDNTNPAALPPLTCTPTTMYLMALYTPLIDGPDDYGTLLPEYYWAAGGPGQIIAANNASNTLCPDSKTYFGYAKFSVSCSICPPSPPGGDNPPPPPSSSMASPPKPPPTLASPPQLPPGSTSTSPPKSPSSSAGQPPPPPPPPPPPLPPKPLPPLPPPPPPPPPPLTSVPPSASPSSPSPPQPVSPSSPLPSPPSPSSSPPPSPAPPSQPPPMLPPPPPSPPLPSPPTPSVPPPSPSPPTPAPSTPASSPPPPAAPPSPTPPRAPKAPKAPKAPRLPREPRVPSPPPPKPPPPPLPRSSPPPSPPPSSPPPPPPRLPQPRPLPSNKVLVDRFPFSSCTARDETLTPFRMSPPGGPYNATLSASPATATYCFTVGEVGGSSPASPCARMTINKIELIVNRACVEESPKAARAASINGVPVYPFYSIKTWRGEVYGLMAVSRLTETFPVIPSGGLRLCLAMDATGATACGSPAGLCYGNSCVYSLFNDDLSCCPASQVPYGGVGR